VGLFLLGKKSNSIRMASYKRTKGEVKSRSRQELHNQKGEKRKE